MKKKKDNRLCEEGEHDMVEYKAMGVRDENKNKAVDVFYQCKKCGGMKRVRTHENVEGLPPGITDWFRVDYPKDPEKIQLNR